MIDITLFGNRNEPTIDTTVVTNIEQNISFKQPNSSRKPLHNIMIIIDIAMHDDIIYHGAINHIDMSYNEYLPIKNINIDTDNI